MKNVGPFSGELFLESEADKAMLAAGVGADLSALKAQWTSQVNAVMVEATLDLQPADTWMQTGGKEGNHSEHLGYILAELQYMQRAYPGMEW